jgi:anoctamin-8
LCGRAEFLEDLGFVLFAFFNVIWSTLYLESWKRRSAEMAYRSGTADQRPELLAEPRPLFKVQKGHRFTCDKMWLTNAF